MQDRSFPPCLDQPGSSATNYKPPGFATGVGDWRWWSINPRGTTQPKYEFHNKQWPGSLIQQCIKSTLCPLSTAAFSSTPARVALQRRVIHTHKMAQVFHPALPPEGEMAADGFPVRSSKRNMRQAVALTVYIYICMLFSLSRSSLDSSFASNSVVIPQTVYCWSSLLRKKS